MRSITLFGATMPLLAAADLNDDWETFKSTFNKKYEGAEEELKRFKIFLATAAKVEKLAALDDGTATFSAITPFADMSEEEFAVKKLGLKATPEDEKRIRANQMDKIDTSDTPSSWDWREKGAVNDVKNQAQCGSCWAFGTVANIEGAYAVQKGGALPSLSEQELVECSASDNGCNGGLPSRAYGDMLKKGLGLEYEADYPYTSGGGSVGTCSAETDKEKVFIDDWKSISTDEDEIAAALVQYGPLAIGINAGYLQAYTGGILDPWFCNPLALDHAVNIVGFGEENGTKYWVIRNSWASSWGEDGYFRIKRGKGKCGVNRMVTTALFNKDRAESSIIV